MLSDIISHEQITNHIHSTSEVEMSFILWRCKEYWQCVTHKNFKASQIKGPKPQQGTEREVPFFCYMIPRVPTQRKTIPLTEYNIPNSCTLLQESYSTKLTIVKSVWICSDIIRLWQSCSGHTFHFTTKNYWWYLSQIEDTNWVDFWSWSMDEEHINVRIKKEEADCGITIYLLE